MSMLTIYPDTDPGEIILSTRDGARIADALGEIGVMFRRWDAKAELGLDSAQDDVLQAYEREIAQLVEEGGYQSMDVVRMRPDHPERETMRRKFLAEHTHADDEVRFFVEGAGAFYLRKNGKVLRVLCERDDLINVPAGTTHWFDAGPAPRFCAIRLFVTPDGWVGNFTGDDIASRFPLFDQVA